MNQVGAVVSYSGTGLAHGVATELFPMFIPLPGSPLGFNVAVGDMEGNGHDDLAISFERGGPGVVAIWSGMVLTQNPGISPSQLPMAALFLALPGNTGARLAMSDVAGSGRAGLVAMSDVAGSGRAGLVAVSEDPSNGQARMFTFSQVQAGAAARLTLTRWERPYTVNGVYAGPPHGLDQPTVLV